MTFDDYKRIEELTADNTLSTADQQEVDRLNEIIRCDPTNLQARMKKGFILFEAHMDGNAIKVFNEVLEIDPNCVDAYIWLVEFLLFHWANSKSAMPLLEKAKEIAPDRAEIYYLWACARQKANDSSQSVTYFKQAVALQPSWIGPRMCLVQQLIDEGRNEEAKIELIALEKQLQPNFPVPEDEMLLYYENLITGRVLTEYAQEWLKRLRDRLFN